jgi:hypothetical protein
MLHLALLAGPHRAYTRLACILPLSSPLMSNVHVSSTLPPSITPCPTPHLVLLVCLHAHHTAQRLAGVAGQTSHEIAGEAGVQP